MSGTTQTTSEFPIANASLALFSDSAVFQTASNSAGKFTFEKVPPGAYELQAIVSGTKRTIQELRVPDLSLNDIEVTLRFLMSEPAPLQALPRYEHLADPSVNQLSGAILRSANKPLSKVRVVLVNESTYERVLSRTDRHGNFVATLPKPGRYTLTASHNGYSPAVVSHLWAVSGQSAHLIVQLDEVGAIFQ